MTSTVPSASSARVRRWWTEQEDTILREEANAQLNAGALKDWNRIAEKLPGRTNKDCRKRWGKVCEQVNKGTWSAEEDKRLEAAVLLYGGKWTHVAAAVGTRHSDQCAKRWQHSLDPNLDRGEWTEKDDKRLLAAVAVSGRNWKAIGAKNFPSRSATDIKNRYVMIDRRRKQARGSKGPSSISSSSMAQDVNEVMNDVEDTSGSDFSFATPPPSTTDERNRNSSILSIDSDMMALVSDESDIDPHTFSKIASSAPSQPHTPAEVEMSHHFDPMQPFPTPASEHYDLDSFPMPNFSSYDTSGNSDTLISHTHSTGPYSAVIEPVPSWPDFVSGDANHAHVPAPDHTNLWMTPPPTTIAQPLPVTTSHPTPAQHVVAPIATLNSPQASTPAQEWVIGGNDEDNNAAVKEKEQKMVLVLEGVEMETLNGVIATLLHNKRKVRMRLFTADE